MMQTIAPVVPALGKVLLNLWHREGYRSKPAELVLYFLTISGLVLWAGFDVPWQFQRTTLALHILVSLLAFPIFVLPFWLAHRGILKRSETPLLRVTGQLIEYALILLVLSGLYLVLYGNRGNLPGQVAYWLHLLPAVPLAVVVIRHSRRWSMLKSLKWLAGLALALAVLGGAAFAAEESGALVQGKDERTLFSANFETGSLSWIDRETGELLGQAALGRDIRRLAEGNDGVIAATDYADGSVIIYDWKAGNVINRFAVGRRPFGIVHDAANGLFWVSLFEDHELVAVDPDKGAVFRIATEDTPRGLALLADGRLIVTHAMIGKVSIFDTSSLPLASPRVIELAATHDPDEFASQGHPRLLDDIAVNRDGTEAWLPHVLWNFDHLFQFQSTVFPAVSVLDLTPEAERELVHRRKQLFRQIDVNDPVQTRFDGSPKKIILSNPFDAAFAPDQSKVLVTLAGSEDLMVFDLTQRDPITAQESQAKDAVATQLLRHLPGANPRGLVVAGRDVYVQNAMSLDLTRLQLGAEVTIRDAQFASLVRSDPLSPELRAGMTLFHTGNTDRNETYPMTGDFWMSCQSCHVDGFNFTNGYLYDATALDKYRYARTGHGNLSR
ncbi:MAG: hypothetical protein AAF891_03600, partial [Pseudomonadota bacterium]